MTEDSGSDVDRDVRDALAQALNEKKMRVAVKLSDRRLLLLYVLIIAMFAAFAWFVDQSFDAYAKFRVDLTGACEDIQGNTVSFNAAVDKISESARANTAIPAAEREERAAFYDSLKQTVPTCPPRG